MATDVWRRGGEKKEGSIKEKPLLHIKECVAGGSGLSGRQCYGPERTLPEKKRVEWIPSFP